MTNTELLQESYNLAGVYIGASAVQLSLAIRTLEEANEQCNNLRTWEHIRDLRMRHADIEWLGKQMQAVKFIEKPEDKKTSQCYNCEGSGTIRDYDGMADMPCPVCDGSGTILT